MIFGLALSQENQAGSKTIQAQEKMPLNTFTVGIASGSFLDITVNDDTLSVMIALGKNWQME